MTQQLAPVDETALLSALRERDESAFETLVDLYGPAMRRFALALVPAAAAEDLVREAWLRALRGLDGGNPRPPLKSWLCRLVAQTAKTPLPFDAEVEADDPCVAPDRFRGAVDQYPGGWLSFPPSWGPDERLAADETREIVARAITALPPGQRLILSLHDIEGWDAAEVCNVLEVSETNQRVLLHRARSKIRAALEQHVARETR